MTTFRFLHASLQLLVGAPVLCATAALAPAQDAAPPAADESTPACKCECEACRKKHGAKPVAMPSPGGVGVTGAGVAEVTDVSEPLATEAGQADMSAEIARVLETDLAEVESLLGGQESTSTKNEPEAAARGSEERGYLGVTLSPEGDGDGALLMAVVPGSPAEKAGLEAGDLIVAAEEFPVESFQELINVMSTLKVGDTATIEYERDGGDKRVVMVNLGRRSMLDAATSPAVRRQVILPEVPVSESAAVDGQQRVVLQWEPGSEPEEILLEEGEREVGSETEDEVVLPDSAPELIITFEEETETRQGGGPLRKPLESDLLPEGYVEIQTRRERRPAASAETADRIRRLEAQVRELELMIQELRRELDRRNPR